MALGNREGSDRDVRVAFYRELPRDEVAARLGKHPNLIAEVRGSEPPWVPGAHNPSTIECVSAEGNGLRGRRGLAPTVDASRTGTGPV